MILNCAEIVIATSSKYYILGFLFRIHLSVCQKLRGF